MDCYSLRLPFGFAGPYYKFRQSSRWSASMIFPGRMLASSDGITVWQRHQGTGYHLHLVTRGLAIDLSPEELAALARVAAAAVDAAQAPEEAKDHARRLQILQARVTDYIRRDRANANVDEAGEGA
jgi:hypothetical protein